MNMASWLETLGLKFRKRLQKLGRLGELGMSIGVIRWAIAVTPDRNPDMISLLETLGNSLSDDSKAWDGSRIQRRQLMLHAGL